MTKLRSIALAAGVPVALLAPPAHSAAAVATSSTTTVAVAAYPPPTGEFPADWTIVVDDTQTIVIAVPSTWSGIDTVPAVNDDRTPRPWISATTDEAAFFPGDAADDFGVPGVIYIAVPYESDTVGVLAASEYHQLCAADPLQTFDNGIFFGHIQSFTGCGGTATRILQVAAHPVDSSFTAYVLVQLTGQPDDAATLDGLLSSFGRHIPPATG